ncbi:ABC transporter ATP-binding protein, partial [Duodenibacillus massiliensis]|uniref:ABC transporter ATP-binding protein n=1 Tax=Duodenibacillus massiliensis TaxID=1852381 RepID=UPI00307B46B8
MNSPVLVLEHVRKSYAENGRVVPVLKDVTFSVERGETIAVIGASGSGKSTLLHAAGGLDGFDAGSIRLDGEELAGLNGAALDSLRNRKLGFIYQFHHLLPEFTALENAAMPLLIARVPREKAFAKAKALLEKVGLGKRLEHLPSELSGGERQRTAVARARAAEPGCIRAEGPSGSRGGGA